jgi:hypothetical protein
MWKEPKKEHKLTNCITNISEGNTEELSTLETCILTVNTETRDKTKKRSK